MNVYWIFNVLITDTQLLPLYIRFHLIVIYTTVQTIVFIKKYTFCYNMGYWANFFFLFLDIYFFLFTKKSPSF